MNRRKFLATSGALLAAAQLPQSAQARALAYSDYAGYDAVGLAELIARGEVSAGEVLEAAIARAEAVNPVINAVVLKHYELARAAVSRGLPAGPLRGVPLLLKDLGVGLKGTVTTNGCRPFRDAVATENSTVVDRYLAAGMVIFGKTASPEFGQTPTTESLLWGLTRNPWDLAYSAGGSSGGAAAAVAAGIIPAAHASDGGGSIRIPASNCGLFGLKPSRGRLPFGPRALESWMGLSMMHVISRSVRDSAVLLDATQGAEAGSRVVPPVGAASYRAGLAAPLKPLRIALWDKNPFGLPVHADCQAALAHAAKLCADLGHRVEHAAPQLPVQEMFAGMGVMTGTGLLLSIRDREKALGRRIAPEELEKVNAHNLTKAAGYSAEDIYRARATFDRGGRVLDEFFGTYDLILSPVMAIPPPKLGVMSLDQDYDKFVAGVINSSPFTAPYNMSGHPAMSVPLFWNSAGLPIGSQFAARFGDELTLLQLAAQLEQAAPWAARRPALETRKG